LVHRRRDGRTHFLSLAGEPLGAASEWLERHRRFWEGSFDRLAAMLAEEVKNSPQKQTARQPTKKKRT